MLQQDAIFMARALALAKKGRYTADPNPCVGCVIVKDGRIMGEGWHAKAGQPHAEPNALSHVQDASGATAYVTLEPCNHHGRTPPCTQALIAAGIRRVVIAMQDPNPLVSGQGIKTLQSAGIEVICGVLQQDAEQLNRGFISRMVRNRPFVRSKLGMSLDGRTAMASGESKWITSPQARQDVQLLRAESSAILTGINTVLADDPRLDVRVDFEVEQPIRVVLDSQLRMPTTAKIAAIPGRCWVLTCSNDAGKRHALEKVGFETYSMDHSQGTMKLDAIMAFLANQQINSLLVETGAILNGALLAQQWIDEYIIYMSPCVLGHQGRGLFTLANMHSMADKKNLTLIDTRQIGPDLKLTLTPQ